MDRSPSRASHAAHGHADLRTAAGKRPLGHGPHRGFADGTLALDDGCRYAQQVLLGLVGVSDEAAVHVGRAACDRGQHLGDPAPGAGFGGGDQGRTRQQRFTHAPGQRLQAGIIARIAQSGSFQGHRRCTSASSNRL